MANNLKKVKLLNRQRNQYYSLRVPIVLGREISLKFGSLLES